MSRVVRLKVRNVCQSNCEEAHANIVVWDSDVHRTLKAMEGSTVAVLPINPDTGAVGEVDGFDGGIIRQGPSPEGILH